MAPKKGSKERSQIFKKPCEAKKPAVKSKESPGRKNPIKRPDSAKIMAKRPIYPTDFIVATRSRPIRKSIMFLFVAKPCLYFIPKQYTKPKKLQAHKNKPSAGRKRRNQSQQTNND